jgi:glycosyltransferase involved in cell wall biosynthesis
MKIVAISGSLVPSNVANSIQAMKAVHALAQLGHEVTLIVPADASATSAMRQWENLQLQYGLSTRFSIEWLPAASRRLFFLSAVRRAKTFKPDLVYVWPLQSAVLGLMLGMPVILELHDLPSGRIGPLYYRYFRDSKGKKRITVITRALREALNERFGAFLRPADVILAPNGVELERFANLPTPKDARRLLSLPEAPTAICTGHLYAGRGVETFLELAAKMRGVHFLWAGGKPEDVDFWKEKAAAKALTNVTFSGFVHNAQLPVHQAAADVLLMPYGKEIGISSGGGNSAQVSSPMKMFEYLASGRAILASDLPVFREVLTDENAVFCPPDNVNMWKGALQALLDDPSRRAALSKQALLDAQKYSWTERARRILEGFPG